MIRAEPLRFSAILLFTAFMAPGVRADEETELSFHAGKMTLNMGKAAVGGKTAPGSSYGVRYLHSKTPFIALGVDVDFLRSARQTSDTLIENGITSFSIDSSSIFGVARLGPTEGKIRPYFLLGLGAHFTSLSLESKPQPGFGWSDTGTTEKRKLIDSGGRGPAVKVQGGADYAFTDNFLAGGFLAYNYLGNAAYETTAQGKALGVKSVNGSMSAITFGLNLAARF